MEDSAVCGYQPSQMHVASEYQLLGNMRMRMLCHSCSALVHIHLSGSCRNRMLDLIGLGPIDHIYFHVVILGRRDGTRALYI